MFCVCMLHESAHALVVNRSPHAALVWPPRSPFPLKLERVEHRLEVLAKESENEFFAMNTPTVISLARERERC